ncbi:substrate-binding domain-containing protein [Streptomyces sp. NPDC014646]|uniref:substrate-binding domain-containing protein n=1 Tax=unclassified Streptomyces TaxID=2593676 RepID=UPI0037025CAF
MPVPGHRVRHCPFDIPGGRRAATELLAPADRPTALFAVNDLAALGAMGAARDLGLRPGSDFALIGFNDTPPRRRTAHTVDERPLTHGRTRSRGCTPTPAPHRR